MLTRRLTGSVIQITGQTQTGIKLAQETDREVDRKERIGVMGEEKTRERERGAKQPSKALEL